MWVINEFFNMVLKICNFVITRNAWRAAQIELLKIWTFLIFQFVFASHEKKNYEFSN